MMFIECTTVDQNGSGLQFPTWLRADRVVAVMTLPEGTVKGALAMIVIDGAEKPAMVVETRSNIMGRLRVAMLEARPTNPSPTEGS